MKDFEIVSIPMNTQECEVSSRCCPGEYIGV